MAVWPMRCHQPVAWVSSASLPTSNPVLASACCRSLRYSYPTTFLPSAPRAPSCEAVAVGSTESRRNYTPGCQSFPSDYQSRQADPSAAADRQSRPPNEWATHQDHH